MTSDENNEEGRIQTDEKEGKLSPAYSKCVETFFFPSQGGSRLDAARETENGK